MGKKKNKTAKTKKRTHRPETSRSETPSEQDESKLSAIANLLEEQSLRQKILSLVEGLSKQRNQNRTVKQQQKFNSLLTKLENLIPNITENFTDDLIKRGKSSTEELKTFKGLVDVLFEFTENNAGTEFWELSILASMSNLINQSLTFSILNHSNDRQTNNKTERTNSPESEQPFSFSHLVSIFQVANTKSEKTNALINNKTKKFLKSYAHLQFFLLHFFNQKEVCYGTSNKLDEILEYENSITVMSGIAALLVLNLPNSRSTNNDISTTLAAQQILQNPIKSLIDSFRPPSKDNAKKLSVADCFVIIAYIKTFIVRNNYQLIEIFMLSNHKSLASKLRPAFTETTDSKKPTDAEIIVNYIENTLDSCFADGEINPIELKDFELLKKASSQATLNEILPRGHTLQHALLRRQFIALKLAWSITKNNDFTAEQKLQKIKGIFNKKEKPKENTHVFLGDKAIIVPTAFKSQHQDFIQKMENDQVELNKLLAKYNKSHTPKLQDILQQAKKIATLTETVIQKLENFSNLISESAMHEDVKIFLTRLVKRRIRTVMLTTQRYRDFYFSENLLKNLSNRVTLPKRKPKKNNHKKSQSVPKSHTKGDAPSESKTESTSEMSRTGNTTNGLTSIEISLSKDFLNKIISCITKREFTKASRFASDEAVKAHRNNDFPRYIYCATTAIECDLLLINRTLASEKTEPETLSNVLFALINETKLLINNAIKFSSGKCANERSPDEKQYFEKVITSLETILQRITSTQIWFCYNTTDNKTPQRKTSSGKTPLAVKKAPTSTPAKPKISPEKSRKDNHHTHTPAIHHTSNSAPNHDKLSMLADKLAAIRTSLEEHIEKNFTTFKILRTSKKPDSSQNSGQSEFEKLVDSEFVEVQQLFKRLNNKPSSKIQSQLNSNVSNQTSTTTTSDNQVMTVRQSSPSSNTLKYNNPDEALAELRISLLILKNKLNILVGKAEEGSEKKKDSSVEKDSEAAITDESKKELQSLADNFHQLCKKYQRLTHSSRYSYVEALSNGTTFSPTLYQGVTKKNSNETPQQSKKPACR